MAKIIQYLINFLISLVAGLIVMYLPKLLSVSLDWSVLFTIGGITFAVILTVLNVRYCITTILDDRKLRKEQEQLLKRQGIKDLILKFNERIEAVIDDKISANNDQINDVLSASIAQINDRFKAQKDKISKLEDKISNVEQSMHKSDRELIELNEGILTPLGAIAKELEKLDKRISALEGK
jgi:peptidoglycan hydrolase CwlO-like protein